MLRTLYKHRKRALRFEGRDQYFVSLIPPIDTKYMVLPTGD